MTRRTLSILVIEDDPALNRLMVDQLKRLGFAAVGCNSMAAAETHIQQQEPAVVLLDLRLPDVAGMDAIARFRDLCPVIILTAYGSVEQAVQAVQAGAADFLIKPVSPNRLELSVTRALETASMRRKIEHLETQVRARSGPRMIGDSKAFEHIREMIGLVARANTTVLVEGESGVGKELVAESIHAESPRHDAPLVTIDCATLHENLLESELFGHEKGAFTGAESKKEGLIEVAENGTVFLDEIGEISPAIQAKLLRVLETSRFRRLGGTRDLSANVRFIAATNRNLADFVKAGSFRGDLFYRLSPFVISVPPLRERREDILPIARNFLESRSFMRNVRKAFHASTEQALRNYSWPGNIRELRNVVERGLLMSADQPTILPPHLSLPTSPTAMPGSFNLSFDHEPTMDEVKEALVTKVLAAHGGNKSKAARALGISERNMYRITSPGDDAK
jgi:DNA-binding NtrC family response regulator